MVKNKSIMHTNFFREQPQRLMELGLTYDTLNFDKFFVWYKYLHVYVSTGNLISKEGISEEEQVHTLVFQHWIIQT